MKQIIVPAPIIKLRNNTWYRCYGRRLSVCDLCSLRFKCWTAFKDDMIITNINEDTTFYEEDNILHIEAASNFEELIKYMNITEVEISGTGTELVADIGKQPFLVGAFHERNRRK